MACLPKRFIRIALLGLIATVPLVATLAAPRSDPCNKIAGQEFVPPSDALACLKSFSFNRTLQNNVMDVVSGVLDFFTFEDWYFDSPPPFQESTLNIPKELARIRNTRYPTDYDFNRAVYNFTNRLNDGHTRYLPFCYLNFQTRLPTPVVTLERNGTQAVFVMPDLVQVISNLPKGFTSYFDEIGFDWKRLAGAKVLEIEGVDAYAYADKVASMESGQYLDHGVRINSVFSSYSLSKSTFSQRFGDIAETTFPDRDTLTMKVVPANSTNVETIEIPFVSTYTGSHFKDKASYWRANCLARGDTNGADLRSSTSFVGEPRQPNALIIDTASTVRLPNSFVPSLPTLPEDSGVVKSYSLPGRKTGVLFVGSFDADFNQFQNDIKTAIETFKSAGVTRLMIDLTNNGGGYICLGQFLYQYLAGTKFGYPGFQTTSRANSLAQKILAAHIAQNHTNNAFSWYAPDQWAFLNDTKMPFDFNYNNPSVPFPINGETDPQSIRFHDNCPRFFYEPIPKSPPFDLSNARCGSTCAMFSTLMFERHQTKIAIFGGKPGLQMEYKGMAGNQVLEWSDLNTEFKTTGLKDDPWAPPDLLVNANMRHNWRIAWSFLNENYPIGACAQNGT
ncbi:hypothetical protein NLI96_g7672 [Meripilus lineatus]|uniref:Tail specific protease domain-containing protein n=1 Tax=Meripilus lineatus TaxID=2056292 RepID=A0AAD5YEP4_9APHY|nr:hypothetical protein NLI96_g7672 [Physisporinus lineatus]